MPIILSTPIRRLSQAEFGELAHEVMGNVFAIHQELGRFFDESIYKRELAHRIPEVQLEVPVEAQHTSFTKRYSLDVLVANGGLFEFKAAESIAPRHRAQLLNYLMLAELAHGKLVNVRPERVEHEFVNTNLRHADRIQFAIQDANWNRDLTGSDRFRELLTAILRDWGTGLDLQLYQEALTHVLGGEDQVVREVEVSLADHFLGHQTMRLAAPGIAFKLTALGDRLEHFADHAARLRQHTALRVILWANIGLKTVTFTTIK